jgi:hypothetical protein
LYRKSEPARGVNSNKSKQKQASGKQKQNFRIKAAEIKRKHGPKPPFIGFLLTKRFKNYL